MPTYQKDVCPRCRADVSRRFGLITTPTIICRVCQYPMRVTATAVMNNWGWNFVAPVIMVLWASAVVIIFCSPQTAAHWAREFGVTPAGDAIKDRLAMVLLSGVLALFCSMPFLVVGRIIGFFVAQRLLSEPPPEVAASELAPPRQFLSQLSTPVGREQTRSKATVLGSNPTAGAYGVAIHPAAADPTQTAGGGLRFLAVAFFGLLWAAVFFFGAAMVMAAVVTAGITDPQLRQQASRHAGETWGI